MTQGGHTLHFYYDAQNKPAIVIYDGTSYGYLYNLQGDVVALVDETGIKVVEYTYDAWGNSTGKTGTLASTLGTVQPFRYRGYAYDEETNLYYLRSRYYNPRKCRFLTSDVFTIETSIDYVYCNNTPINSEDSDGYLPNGFYVVTTTSRVKLRNKPQEIGTNLEYPISIPKNTQLSIHVLDGIAYTMYGENRGCVSLDYIQVNREAEEWQYLFGLEDYVVTSKAAPSAHVQNMQYVAGQFCDSQGYFMQATLQADGICGPITRDSICTIIGLHTRPEYIEAYEKQRLWEVMKAAGINMYADDLEEMINQMGRG